MNTATAARRSTEATKASAAVEMHWAGKPGAGFAHGKAAEKHLAAARAFLELGLAAKASAHIELATRHTDAALDA